MSAVQDGPVRFGAFELDPRTGELRKAGVRINLPEQPCQVLKALLERPGDLVTREDLRQRLWRAETFVDFEQGLNAAVRRLREALGDSAESPRFVETLPRRGYRFIAPVLQPAPEIQPLPSSGRKEQHDGAGTATRPRRAARLTSPWRVALAALIPVAGAALLWTAGYLPGVQAPSPTDATGRFMLAVLPFENLTGSPDHEYIGDGMTEELIGQLGRLEPSRLGVIARTSAMHFKKTTQRADRIGFELGVSYLVEGSVRTTGSRIRIAAQLIETRSESQVWTDQYERDAKDLLTLQREIAEAITREITTRLGVAPLARNSEARRHSASSEAYSSYLRGRHHWLKNTPEELAKAKALFLAATESDPSYALAHSGLSDTYASLGGGGFMPMHEAYRNARASAQRAIELDETLAEAHTSMASIANDYDWDWSKADSHFKRAVTLDPNYQTALRFYAFYLACMGRHEEALELSRRGRDLDPVSPDAWTSLGVIHYFARRFADATKAFEETLELDPTFGQAYVMLGRIEDAQGRADRAVAHLERAKALDGARPGILTPYAYMLAKAGRKRDALATLDELRRLAKPRDPSPFRIAIVQIALGDKDRSFEFLEKALETRDWQMALLNVEPAFDSLRSDPRFGPLVARVGLPATRR